MLHKVHQFIFAISPDLVSPLYIWVTYRGGKPISKLLAYFTLHRYTVNFYYDDRNILQRGLQLVIRKHSKRLSCIVDDYGSYEIPQKITLFCRKGYARLLVETRQLNKITHKQCKPFRVLHRLLCCCV